MSDLLKRPLHEEQREGLIEEGRRVRDPESEARAQAFARDTRTKFERVYESARRAVAAGDAKTAVVKCKAALDLLREKDIYGPQQPALVEQLTGLVERLSMKE